jgi:hypothetical protein
MKRGFRMTACLRDVKKQVSLVAGALLVVAAVAAVASDQATGGRARSTYPSGPEMAAALDAGVSAEQRGALADGVVTRQEYEAAIEATAVCLERTGAPAGVKVLRDAGAGPAGTTRLTWTSTVGDAETGASELMRGCFERHSSAVHLVWELENVPSPQTLERRSRAIGTCLAAAGLSEVQGMIMFDVQKKFGPASREAIGLLECHEANR